MPEHAVGFLLCRRRIGFCLLGALQRLLRGIECLISLDLGGVGIGERLIGRGLSAVGRGLCFICDRFRVAYITSACATRNGQHPRDNSKSMQCRSERTCM